MRQMGAAQTGVVERDRDSEGRPRNARPRDGLGRPLPHGTPGVPRQPEGVLRTPDQTLEEAQRLLDADLPFHAHDVFEDAWKAARGRDDAALWRALAQLAVGWTHRLRGNTVGAARLLNRAETALQPYSGERPYGIDVDALRQWAREPADNAIPPLRPTSGRDEQVAGR